jgi:hypothetical protein
MSNEAVQAILLVIILIAILAIVFVPFLAFIGYALYQKSKRNRIRQRLLSEHQQLVGGRQWFPVRYASEPRFNSLFKIFPWEGAGVLVIAAGSALFLGETTSNPRVMLQFAPATSQLNWLGKAPWPNGAISWFYFAMANGKHYFSSETGILVFGSHKSTKSIYDEAHKSFLAQSAAHN